MALRSVSTLLESFGADVWRADALAQAIGVGAGVVATGHAALDTQLPGGGWPVGALCEILQDHPGQHEWRLLLPALRSAKGKVVLVGAPHVPFGPGLSAQGLDLSQLVWVQAESVPDRLWAAEQALRCAGVQALLLWLPSVRSDHLRRLHLAAQAQAKWLWVMRPASAQDESSPAVLRLSLGEPASAGGQSAAQPGSDRSCLSLGLPVRILKRRGPPLAQVLDLPARPAQLSVLLTVQGSGHALDRLAATA
jgi:protein ImuA